MSDGDHTSVRVERGVLVEYTLTSAPLVFAFELNPRSITRSRRLDVHRGEVARTQGGHGFADPSEVARAAQGVTVQAESITLTILLDATDRMGAGDPIASNVGVQPEIDTLRSMLEPKEQASAGVRRMAAVGAGDDQAHASHQHPAVLVFKWGPHILPVFMTEVRIETKAHLPDLHPYRAEATITLQIIEGSNPIYDVERRRQFASAASHLSLAGLLTDFVDF